MDFEKLKAFAFTKTQEDTLQAMIDFGSQRKAAKALSMSQSALNERLRNIKAEAARRGYVPDIGMDAMQPEGQLLSGVSTLYNGDGEVVSRWVKMKADHEEIVASAKAMIDEMCKDIPKAPPVKQVKKLVNHDLLNLFVLTDAHLGMYAHHEEGGANWDLKIAETTVNSAFEYLITHTPSAETAVLCNLGDLLHSDGIFPVTPTSHHVLDQDSRYHRVIRAAIRCIRATMKRLLETHKNVVLLNCQGNHDLSSALWLQESFSAMYEQEERADVIVSPLPYYAIEHGDCALGFAHGHKKKGQSLADLFTGQFRDLIGRTKHTFIHTGHLHQQELIETPSSTIEQHPTLAARDSHASGGGWLSKRGMNGIVYHKKHFEIARSTYRPHMGLVG